MKVESHNIVGINMQQYIERAGFNGDYFNDDHDKVKVSITQGIYT